jgi:hypothetical protein
LELRPEDERRFDQPRIPDDEKLDACEGQENIEDSWFIKVLIKIK